MLHQPPDLTDLILREQLKDRERELQSARRSRLAERCGDLLNRIGSRLKHATPCPEPTQEMAWPDHG